MFLVVFRNRKRAGFDATAYRADAERMEQLASTQPGFLSFKSYTAEDGEVIALSEWTDEASARAWGGVEDHAGVQGRGRADYYAEYTMFACTTSRIHRFVRPDPQ